MDWLAAMGAVGAIRSPDFPGSGSLGSIPGMSDSGPNVAGPVSQSFNFGGSPFAPTIYARTALILAAGAVAVAWVWRKRAH